MSWSQRFPICAKSSHRLGVTLESKLSVDSAITWTSPRPFNALRLLRQIDFSFGVRFR
jgi:hypothetical protein